MPYGLTGVSATFQRLLDRLIGPEIKSFEPVMGPWEGNTNVTIRGINLGKTFKVRKVQFGLSGLVTRYRSEI